MKRKAKGSEASTIKSTTALFVAAIVLAFAPTASGVTVYAEAEVEGEVWRWNTTGEFSHCTADTWAFAEAFGDIDEPYAYDVDAYADFDEDGGDSDSATWPHDTYASADSNGYGELQENDRAIATANARATPLVSASPALVPLHDSASDVDYCMDDENTGAVDSLVGCVKQLLDAETCQANGGP